MRIMAMLIVLSAIALATCTPPGSGAWTINADESCTISDTTITGPAYVNVYGNLTLSNVNLTFSMGAWNQSVLNFTGVNMGTLYLHNDSSSFIDRSNISSYYAMTFDCARFDARNSWISSNGYDIDISFRCKYNYFENTTIYPMSQGNYYSDRFFDGGTFIFNNSTITDNNFLGTPYSGEGAFFQMTNGNFTFENSQILYYCSYYPAQTNKIGGNVNLTMHNSTIISAKALFFNVSRADITNSSISYSFYPIAGDIRINDSSTGLSFSEDSRTVNITSLNTGNVSTGTVTANDGTTLTIGNTNITSIRFTGSGTSSLNAYNTTLAGNFYNNTQISLNNSKVISNSDATFDCNQMNSYNSEFIGNNYGTDLFFYCDNSLFYNTNITSPLGSWHNNRFFDGGVFIFNNTRMTDSHGEGSYFEFKNGDFTLQNMTISFTNPYYTSNTVYNTTNITIIDSNIYSQKGFVFSPQNADVSGSTFNNMYVSGGGDLVYSNDTISALYLVDATPLDFEDPPSKVSSVSVQSGAPSINGSINISSISISGSALLERTYPVNVTSANNKPAPNALVTINGSGWTTYTDSRGIADITVLWNSTDPGHRYNVTVQNTTRAMNITSITPLYFNYSLPDLEINSGNTTLSGLVALGRTVNISTVVFNIGDKNATGANISFYNGTDLFYSTLFDVVSGGNTAISTTWNVSGSGVVTLSINIAHPEDIIVDNNNVNISSSLLVYPVADAGLDVNTTYGMTVTLFGSGSDADGHIVLYEWDLDGDGTYDWNSTTTGVVSYAFMHEASLVLTLRVTDNDGLTANDTVLITIPYDMTIINAAPEGSWTIIALFFVSTLLLFLRKDQI